MVVEIDYSGGSGGGGGGGYRNGGGCNEYNLMMEEVSVLPVVSNAGGCDDLTVTSFLLFGIPIWS